VSQGHPSLGPACGQLCHVLASEACNPKRLRSNRLCISRGCVRAAVTFTGECSGVMSGTRQTRGCCRLFSQGRKHGSCKHRPRGSVGVCVRRRTGMSRGMRASPREERNASRHGLAVISCRIRPGCRTTSHFQALARHWRRLPLPKAAFAGQQTLTRRGCDDGPYQAAGCCELAERKGCWHPSGDCL
jgi:hypothetical protein